MESWARWDSRGSYKGARGVKMAPRPDSGEMAWCQAPGRALQVSLEHLSWQISEPPNTFFSRARAVSLARCREAATLTHTRPSSALSHPDRVTALPSPRVRWGRAAEGTLHTAAELPAWVRALLQTPGFGLAGAGALIPRILWHLVGPKAATLDQGTGATKHGAGAPPRCPTWPPSQSPLHRLFSHPSG